MSPNETIRKPELHTCSPGFSFQFLLDRSIPRFEYISDNIQSYTGLDPESISPSGIIDSIHPHDREHYRHGEEIAQHFFTTKVIPEEWGNYKISYQYRLKSTFGYRMILYQWVPLESDEMGRPVRIFGHHTDIQHIRTTNDYKVTIMGVGGSSHLHQVSTIKELDKNDHLPRPYTSRETEVISLLARGYSNCQISEQLYISKATVRTHRRNILSKAKCKNTVEVVSSAIRAGLI